MLLITIVSYNFIPKFAIQRDNLYLLDLWDFCPKDTLYNIMSRFARNLTNLFKSYKSIPNFAIQRDISLLEL